MHATKANTSLAQANMLSSRFIHSGRWVWPLPHSSMAESKVDLFWPSSGPVTTIYLFIYLFYSFICFFKIVFCLLLLFFFCGGFLCVGGGGGCPLVTHKGASSLYLKSYMSNVLVTFCKQS